MPASLSRLVRLAPPARPDRTLLRAFLDGTDPGAFDELVRRHAALARRAAAEVCPTAADDVAQTTLALLARKAAAVAGRESAAGWVFETARRLALKARTAAARRAAHEGQAVPPPPADDPLDALTLREVRAVVAEELARLPDDLRLPLVLHYWDGAGRAEAAARLGCSVSTLRRRLDAGRDRLGAGLARRGFGAPAVLAALTAVQALPASAAVAVTAPRALPWKALAAVVTAVGVASAGAWVSATGSAEPQPVAPAAVAKAAQPGPPADRYGDPLPDGAVARFGTVRFRHGGQVQSVAYSPDGKTIASGGFGRIMLWEAATGKPVGSLVRTAVAEPVPRVQHGHTFGLAFAPDGKRLLSVGSPGVAHTSGFYAFWTLAARKLDVQTEFAEPANAWVRTAAFAPDGKSVALGTDAGALHRLDLKTQDLRTLAKLPGAVAGLSFAPDGETLAVATGTDVVLLDPATGDQTRRLETDRARQVAFHPDGKTLWVGCDGGRSWDPADARRAGTISRWDARTGARVASWETAPGMMLSVAVSPDGKTLASGGQGSGPFLWDTATGTPTDLAPTRRHRPWVQGLAFAPDGKALAVADTDGRVRVWDVAARKELHPTDEQVGGAFVAAVSPDGTRAATAGGDGKVRVWDVATGRPVRSWVVEEKWEVWAAAYTPDGKALLTSGWDGMVRLWNPESGAELRRFGESKRGARAALSPDGALVAASGKDGCSIVLYDTATGRPVRELTGHVSFLMSLAFSPDSRQLFSTADMHSDGKEHLDDRSLRVWDVATGRQLHRIDAGRPHGGLAVSPDGKRVVAGTTRGKDGDDTALRVWDVATGRELPDRSIPRAGGIAFRPDGRFLAAGGRDITIMDAATGAVVRTFRTGAGSVYGLTYTPDGRRLISTHDDGTALVWNPERDSP